MKMPIFSGSGSSATDDAKERLRKLGQTQDTPHIVAELSFGVWTTMLSPRYEQPLWNRALRRAFPEFARIKKRKPTRNEIAQRFDYIRVFRNRIAHHEPIFTRALANDYKSLLEAASWMHADLAEWTSRLTTSCLSLISAGSPLSKRVGQ